MITRLLAGAAAAGVIATAGIVGGTAQANAAPATPVQRVGHSMILEYAPTSAGFVDWFCRISRPIVCR